MNIQDLLRLGQKQLSVTRLPISRESSHLDAELLLGAALTYSRIQLFQHSDQIVTPEQYTAYQALLQRREAGEPIAYILGHQEFWSLKFKVTPDVLIPRPETELMLEWIVTHYSAEQNVSVLELGTGSGAIAIALATERPNWKIQATDISQKALVLAAENAKIHGCTQIQFSERRWLEGLSSQTFDLIISNPPYIAAEDPHLPLLKYEPSSALVSGIDGLADLREIIQEARAYLAPMGCLILEHGFDQGTAVRKLLQAANYHDIVTEKDLAGHERMTVARS